jgi:hypothetical protein
VETDDDQSWGTEPEGHPAVADSVGCAPARQRGQLQRFGRHGRYDWSIRRRSHDDLQAGERRAG